MIIDNELKRTIIKDLSKGQFDFLPILRFMRKEHSEKHGGNTHSSISLPEEEGKKLLAILDKGRVEVLPIYVPVVKHLKAILLKALITGDLNIDLIKQYQPCEFWGVNEFDNSKLTEDEVQFALSIARSRY